ncbi:CHAT domain-containing protein [Tahibacter soli]|uniref:CHAT domain-containing protein n=1 Tax=Tahibacter soli TaxID=2983605 RepID=A0A9X4BJ13_9GAMM|nr:CHAT domain-containing protein [Tahibacter soli]MDC8014606.1 CHAT domain-containing protein [Tahibacter soli]
MGTVNIDIDRHGPPGDAMVVKSESPKAVAAKKPTPRPRAPKKKPQPAAPADDPAHNGLPRLRLPQAEHRLVPEPPDYDEAVLGAFDSVRALRSEAMQWALSVRNRRRWSNSLERVRSLASDAERLVASMLGDDGLAQLAQSEFAQVVVPYHGTDDGWESRIMPWEFLLTSATRTLRNNRPLIVCRQLEYAEPHGPPPAPGGTVLYVESQPGGLRDAYSFTTERALTQAMLCGKAAAKAAGLVWRELKQPTRAELAAKIRQYQPQIVHLAGFDAHQGYRLVDSDLTDRQSARKIDDGYLVVSTDRSEPIENLTAQSLADALTAGGARPALVSLSFWNSSSEIAPALIGKGVGAVIGFQDWFRDDLTEQFFTDFYRSYRALKWNLRDAFCDAVLKLRSRGPAAATGTGAVLWTAAPLIVDAGPQRRAAVDVCVDDAPDKLKAIDPADVPQDKINDYLQIDIEPLRELNYALMHNGRPLFRKFKLVRVQPGRYAGINVHVELCCGQGSFPWRRTVVVDADNVDLSGDIAASLIDTVLRTTREAVNTLVFVEITWGERVLKRDSFTVALPPADLWHDTDIDRWWLPSFVLPRDPAIAALIATAFNYVRVLRDDPAAGFDGYQSIDGARDNPCEDVDLQVLAIWSAIVYDWRLGYINPPPSYGGKTPVQRLRTPSTMLRQRAGTCIDLALLLAACLEYVDIYPVVFLIRGHAFAGYWRSPEAHDRFVDARTQAAADMERDQFQQSTAVTVQSESWVSGPPAYYEIVSSVEANDLVLLEATALTSASGFWQAVDVGQRNLDDANAFELMIDIASARAALVRPLPILGDNA